jgi:hypothetical protein
MSYLRQPLLGVFASQYTPPKRPTRAEFRCAIAYYAVSCIRIAVRTGNPTEYSRYITGNPTEYSRYITGNPTEYSRYITTYVIIFTSIY